MSDHLDTHDRKAMLSTDASVEFHLIFGGLFMTSQRDPKQQFQLKKSAA